MIFLNHQRSKNFLTKREQDPSLFRLESCSQIKVNPNTNYSAANTTL